ncbi:MAG: hypothetical protein JW748_03455 [Anaerolineales bacterium]|nr:hypothetical protein [Anaerolineales bacterium]
MKTRIPHLFTLPEKPGERRIAMLVILTCAAIVLGALALILAWIASGDLELETVAAAGILFLILAGLGLLSLRGGGRAALVILAVLLFLLTAADLTEYGLHTSMASAFLIPILLIACGLGMRAGIGAALVCAAYGWLLAAAENAGWIAVPYPVDISHLTFDAPALTVIYLLCAVIAGYGAGSPHGQDSGKRQKAGGIL